MRAGDPSSALYTGVVPNGPSRLGWARVVTVQGQRVSAFEATEGEYPLRQWFTLPHLATPKHYGVRMLLTHASQNA